MRLIEITDKNRWNDFVGAQTHAEFLQSWEWGEFQEKIEGKIKRFGLEENSELIAAATLVKKSLPFGMNYFYCPRGPIIREELRIKREELSNYFFSEIGKIAKEEKTIFLRIEPKDTIQNSKFKIQNSLDIQPSQTIILDLSKSEEVLLAAMHQKTRYNIRLAEKKGVQIREASQGGFLAGDGEKDFGEFWNLMEKTSGRDGFTPHSKDYYEKLLHTAPGKFKLFFAVVRRSLGEGRDKYEDIIISAGIFSFFGDTVTYLFGASDNDRCEVMAPYLLQWELIKRAKAAGYKFYDFFGIDEKKWPGVTRFKRGFMGQEINYPGTFDIIFNRAKYGLYKILRKLRRLIK